LPARFVARERRGNLRVIVAARKSREDRKISPRQMTVQVVAKAAAGQNPAYSHRKKAGALRNRGAPVHFAKQACARRASRASAQGAGPGGFCDFTDARDDWDGAAFNGVEEDEGRTSAKDDVA